MSDKLHVVAILHVQPENLETVADMCRSLTAASREEPGCLQYEFVLSKNAEAVILSKETWTDEVAFAVHMASSHFKNAIEQITPLLASEPEIHTCVSID